MEGCELSYLYKYHHTKYVEKILKIGSFFPEEVFNDQLMLAEKLHQCTSFRKMEQENETFIFCLSELETLLDG